jgi:hypothetical protein
MLDVAPMPGSKRVPIIEIDANGAASIDLWCASLRGQASVGEDSISIVPGPMQPTQCPADRQSGDESLLAALAQVTNWRRTGDVIELRGATTLRFRLMTNRGSLPQTAAIAIDFLMVSTFSDHALSLRRARHQKRHAHRVVVIGFARHGFEFGAELRELGGIVLE